MVKCAKCSKTVTKKAPGLQCGKCSKWLHASCIPITAEQLSILCDTEAVEWKCKTCSTHCKTKRLSAIIPDPEDEDNVDAEQVIIMKDNFSAEFLKELRNDIRSAIKDEMQRTLQFYSAKIDDFQNVVEDYENKIKTTENQIKDLQHKHSNILLKYASLDQKLNAIEQSQLDNNIEICGIQKKENENILEVTQKIAQKIQVNKEEIVSVYRKERRAPAAQQRVPSSLIVTLKAGRRDHWLASGKTKTITGQDVGYPEDTRIYLREALTPATAFLLWKSKSELKKDNLFKYVWCKGGNVLVRKDDQARIQTVRTEHDIDKLLKVKG